MVTDMEAAMESNRNSDAAPYEQIDLFKIFDHIRLGIRRLFWLAPILIAVFAAAGYFYADLSLYHLQRCFEAGRGSRSGGHIDSCDDLG